MLNNDELEKLRKLGIELKKLRKLGIEFKKINKLNEFSKFKEIDIEFKDPKKKDYSNIQPIIITGIILASICCLTLCSNNKTITTTTIEYSNDKNITIITYKNITKGNK